MYKVIVLIVQIPQSFPLLFELFFLPLSLVLCLLVPGRVQLLVTVTPTPVCPWDRIYSTGLRSLRSPGTPQSTSHTPWHRQSCWLTNSCGVWRLRRLKADGKTDEQVISKDEIIKNILSMSHVLNTWPLYRSMEQLQRWVDGDALDPLSTPLFVPSSILLSMPKTIVQPRTRKSREISITQVWLFIQSLSERLCPPSPRPPPN